MDSEGGTNVGIIFQLVLVVINALIALLNYTNGNYGVAAFNAGVAALCFAIAIAQATDN